MTDLAKLVVRLEAQTTKYQKELERANKKLDRFASKAKKSVSNIKLAFGGLAIGATINKIAQATAKQEQALAQLEQGLLSTGNAAGFTKDELVGFAEELQKVTTFGDEDIIDAQANLLSFYNIAGEQFKRTTEAALDLSARLGKDLKSSVIQLGKALNDPVANLGSLGEAGIQFSKDQKEVIKALVESGRLAEAQTIILDELEKQYGGSARAARDTFGGALQGLKNAFGDLFESKGGLVDSKEAIEDFTDLLQDPKTVNAANALTSALIGGFKLLADGIVKAVKPLRLATVSVSFLTEGIQTLAGSFARFLSILPGSAGDAMDSFRLSMESAAEQTRAWREEIFAAIYASEKLQETPAAEVIRKGPGSGAGFGTILPTVVGEPQKKSLQELNALLAENDRLMAPVIEKWERGRQIFEDTRTPLENMEAAFIELADLLDAGAIDFETYRRAVEQTALQYERLTKKAEESTSTMSTFADEAARNIQDSLADNLFNGFDEGLKGMVLNFANALRRMAAEALSVQILDAVFGRQGPSGFFQSVFGGIFGGARASGGAVHPGSAFIVGERGPELFVPDSRGNIIPNDEINTGSITVNMNLHGVSDAESFRRSRGQIDAQLAMAVSQAGRNL